MKIRGLWKLPSERDWLWVKLGLALVGKAMFSISLMKFYADRWSCDDLYAGQEATVRTGHGLGSKSGNKYIKAVYRHPVYLNYMQSTK